MYPCDIRHYLAKALDEEDAGGEERIIVTLDRTVLDEVTFAEAKMPSRVNYEDVSVRTADGIVPLLEIHDENWLCHSSLGTTFDRKSAEWRKWRKPSVL
jgi:hypothetical protein